MDYPIEYIIVAVVVRPTRLRHPHGGVHPLTPDSRHHFSLETPPLTQPSIRRSPYKSQTLPYRNGPQQPARNLEPYSKGHFQGLSAIRRKGCAEGCSWWWGDADPFGCGMGHIQQCDFQWCEKKLPEFLRGCCIGIWEGPLADASCANSRWWSSRYQVYSSGRCQEGNLQRR